MNCTGETWRQVLITQGWRTIWCILLFLFLGVNFVVGQKTVASPPSKVPVTTSLKWVQESLEAHNFHRKMHSAPPLVLNNTLSEISQYYANHLLELAVNDLRQGKDSIFFDHNPQAGKAKIGENLYYSLGYSRVSPVPAYYAVQLWYEEFKDYDYATAERKPTADPQAKIGHFTQLLWKSTKQMGTAYASSKLKNNQTIVFVVANYYPQGNLAYRGDEAKLYLQNVLPADVPDEDINAAIVSRNAALWWRSVEVKGETPYEWKTLALERHNEFRRAHGVNPLRLNADLCKASQRWADHLLQRGLKDINSFGALGQVETNFAENHYCSIGESAIYYLQGSKKVSAESSVRLWYAQSRHYKFDTNKPDAGRITDGFEKVIWNSTTEFCMTYARDVTETGQQLIYVVANYYPSQADKERKQNVFKPTDLDKTRLVLEDEDDDDRCTGCRFAMTFTIVVCVLIALIAASGVSLILMYYFKNPWYESVMRVIGRRKY